MKLRVILSKEVNTALKAPKRPNEPFTCKRFKILSKASFFSAGMCKS